MTDLGRTAKAGHEIARVPKAAIRLGMRMTRRIPYSIVKIAIYAILMYSLFIILSFLGAFLIADEWFGDLFDLVGAIILIIAFLVIGVASVNLRNSAMNFVRFSEFHPNGDVLYLTGRRLRSGEIATVSCSAMRIKIVMTNGEIRRFSAFLARGRPAEVVATIQRWIDPDS